MINYQIIICYKLLLNINNYFYNLGFYIGFCFLLLFINLFLIYYFIGRRSIKLEYLRKEPDMKKIKQLEIEFNKKYQQLNNKEGTEGIKEIKKIKSKNIPKKSKKPKTHIIINRKNIFKDIKNPLKKSIMKKQSSNTLRKKKEKKKKSTMIIKNNINVKINIDNNRVMSENSNDNIGRKNSSLSNLNLLKTKLLNVENKKMQKNINYNELTFNEALKEDQRNLVQIFLSLFHIKLEFIQITFFSREFSHKSITFSLYLFDLFLDLTINSLLFSDDVISQKYYNNGELRLLTTNILSITSNVISSFLLYLIGKLINYYDLLETINHEIKNKKKYYQILIKISYRIELKIIIFFLILFLIGIFCTYYLFVFCAIYKMIQKNLFINYIIGSFWSLGFTTGICLIVTILRKIALKKKIKRLYLISKFIDDKF